VSNIDKLLTELCPAGVPFHKLEDVFDVRGGYTPSKTDATAWSNGTVPWVRMEDIRKNGRVLHSAVQCVNSTAVKSGRLFPANSFLIATSATVGEHALVTVPHLSNQRFASLSLKSSFTTRYDIRFLFHYFYVLAEWCRSNTKTSSFAAVDMTGFRKFPLPEPPLEVQKEIARILDTFSNLEAELEAELEARRVQHEQYLHTVLDFSSSQEVHFVPLSSLAEYSTSRVDSASLKPTTFVGVDNLLQQLGGRMDATYAPNSERLTEYSPNDVLLGNIRPYLRKLWFADRAGGCSGDVLAIRLRPAARDSIDPKFLYHVLCSPGFWRHNECHAKGAKMPRGDKAAIMRFQVPVPDMCVQQDTIKAFDSLQFMLGDLSSGLPAEIAARRKQYEYYRERLLTFKELEA
jgi:type I restriction enzyme S subunit